MAVSSSWDICISWLCNKCCVLSRACSSLGQTGQGKGGWVPWPPPLVSGLSLPWGTLYGVNLNCPLPVASQVSPAHVKILKGDRSRPSHQ